MCVYLYVYRCVYIFIFQSQCTIKGINNCFTFVLFGERIEYVDNVLCTILVAPSVLEKYDSPCEHVMPPGVCFGKYDTRVNLYRPPGVD